MKFKGPWKREGLTLATLADLEAPTPENMWRLLHPENGRRLTYRRWQHAVEMRQAGLSWKQMGAVLKLSAASAHGLFLRGVQEQQKKVAACPVCGTVLLSIKNFRSVYAAHEKQTRSRPTFYRPYRSRYIAYYGPCAEHGMVWTEPFDRHQPSQAPVQDSRTVHERGSSEGGAAGECERVP